MKLSGNTIFITGGGSGIGRGLAEAFHRRGNQVIIAGRRPGALAETTRAHPGMKALELNVEDPASIVSAARTLIRDYPTLNVLINNAGIMRADDVGGVVDETVLVSTVATNLLGPIRMTSALVGHLKQQPAAVIINVSSGLAFVPLASTAVYSSTKAALHSYTLSLRYKLKGTTVTVLEIAPPWVRTELMPGTDNSPAMPLEEFIAETMTVLGTDAEEVLVERARPLRNNAGPAEAAFVAEFNDRAARHI
ncbi:MAG TPA: SDR family NAD(P)-dependent oxidoreductase [Candidatus Baltobacteraceae bacterium]|nr:SDR family NAD(P)-dependent oxidoreductase [Candidatus Baltobacteraceae bacterium]